MGTLLSSVTDPWDRHFDRLVDEWFDDLAKYRARCWNWLEHHIEMFVPQHNDSGVTVVGATPFFYYFVGTKTPEASRTSSTVVGIWWCPICSYSFLTRACHFFFLFLRGEHSVGVDRTKSSSKEWHRQLKRGRVAASLLLFPSLASTLEYVFQMSKKRQ